VKSSGVLYTLQFFNSLHSPKLQSQNNSKVAHMWQTNANQ